MLSQIEWVAVVLLGIGIVKMIVGLISPKLLLDYKRNPLLKYIMEGKNLISTIVLIMGIILVYFSIGSGISFAEWFVAGFSFYVLMMALFFTQEDIWQGWLKAFSKMPENKFRLIAVAWLIFSFLGLYLIFY
tara:strand:- start:354 stop:749 length:396 start_codon:yes stop_codon:yes gene_type:complete